MIGDEQLRCFVLWCKWNPAYLGDQKLVRAVFDAYRSIEF